LKKGNYRIIECIDVSFLRKKISIPNMGYVKKIQPVNKAIHGANASFVTSGFSCGKITKIKKWKTEYKSTTTYLSMESHVTMEQFENLSHMQ